MRPAPPGDDAVGGTAGGGRGRNPYVFVVGCPRSGTTLLQRMLDHHPRLAVTNDTHFIPKALEGLGPAPGGPELTPDLVHRVRTYRRFRRMGLSEEAVDAAAARARSYAGFVSALYDEVGRARGKPLAGEKTPDYVRRLPMLATFFPWARFVHILRDGRDVALSVLEWARPDKGPGRFALWEEEPVAVCALWWERMVRGGRDDGRTLGGRYLEVRYEDVVAEPAAAIEAVASFLDLAPSGEMLEFHEGRAGHRPGASAKSGWLPPTPGLRDWRTEMSETDVELFEALAGGLLEEAGYERVTATPSRRVAERAERCRALWRTGQARRARA